MAKPNSLPSISIQMIYNVVYIDYINHHQYHNKLTYACLL